MSLIIAVQTLDGHIVVGADSLCLTYGNALGESVEQYSYRCEKIKFLRRNGWLLASAGYSVDSIQKQLEAEVETGKTSPFDPQIAVGGPVYLEALAEKIRTANKGVSDDKMPFQPAILAGFGTDGEPVIFGASLPRPGCSIVAPESPVCILGVQEATAYWIMNMLGVACYNLENVKRLISFTIWQISKLDPRVGNVESGYPLSLCVLTQGSPAQIEHLAVIPEWMSAWEENFQACFRTALNAIPLPNPSP